MPFSQFTRMLELHSSPKSGQFATKFKDVLGVYVNGDLKTPHAFLRSLPPRRVSALCLRDVPPRRVSATCLRAVLRVAGVACRRCSVSRSPRVVELADLDAVVAAALELCRSVAAQLCLGKSSSCVELDNGYILYENTTELWLYF